MLFQFKLNKNVSTVSNPDIVCPSVILKDVSFAKKIIILVVTVTRTTDASIAKNRDIFTGLVILVNGVFLRVIIRETRILLVPIVIRWDIMRVHAMPREGTRTPVKSRKNPPVI